MRAMSKTDLTKIFVHERPLERMKSESKGLESY